ncbi:extracellular solute-binding protein [Paenibacillus roseipurpureus]|uniref:Extracellular solute-binding protein n=1 Tax=Paenibacillus roseopurpureus TaxID=2918901 RepID=A0AA96LRP0_9BACL|nr:extracellular solute-binding protein [Paenibacillus sp. MBLB1832]WNR45976.1 extracellular solute-binding protein [Paenibacillus sp. MBLB1832]
MKKVLSTSVVAVLLISTLAACGSSKDGEKASGSSSSPSSTTKAVEKKYKIRAMNILYGAAPPDNGAGKKAIEERYNIDLEYIPVVSGEYNNKLGVTLASGDVPDIVLIPFLDNQWNTAIDGGQFMPLTKYINDKANYPNFSKISPDLQSILKVKGEVYGIPRFRGVPGQTQVLRKDWMDKLGLKTPTNYDELFEVLKAFKEKDPDGNGKNDTFGATASLNGTDINIGVNMASFKAGPNLGWVEDGKGGIIPSDFAPNTKAAYGYIAKLYKEGLIPQDFAVRKDAQSEDDFLLGKAGSTHGWSYTAYNNDRLKKARAVEPKWAVAPVAPLKAPDGYQGYVKSYGYFGAFLLNKDLLKDEGKLKKALQILNDQMGDEGASFIKWGVEGVHYKVDNGNKVALDANNVDGPNKYHLTDPLAEGDWIFGSADTDEVKKLKKDSFKVAMEGKPWLRQEEGLYSKANAEKGAELKKYVTDEMIKVIMGEKPVDYIDQIFESWKSRGGNDIMKEFNDAWKNRKDGK